MSEGSSFCDVFSDRPFGGYPNVPLVGAGPWENLVLAPGWSEDSVCCARTLYSVRSTQLSGILRAELRADAEVEISLLPETFRPDRAWRFIVPTVSGEWADLEIENDGRVVLRSRAAMIETRFRRVYALAGL